MNDLKTHHRLTSYYHDIKERKGLSYNIHTATIKQNSNDNDLASLSWLQKSNLLKIPPLDHDDYLATQTNDLNPIDEARKKENIEEVTSKGDSYKKGNKPNYSYTHLIFMAIESTPNKYMTVNQIYNWCETNFPFYKQAGTGWKNSLRHNLSINKSFKRLPRDNRGSGRGAYWAVEPRERQNLVDGLNRNPWNVTAIACSGSPKINESGHMNVTATLNSLGCNRYSKLGYNSFLQNMKNFSTGGPNSLNSEIAQESIALECHTGDSFYSIESPKSMLSQPITTSTGSSSLISASDSYFSTYNGIMSSESNEPSRKFFSDDGIYLGQVFNETSVWTEEDNLLFEDAFALLESNPNDKKLREITKEKKRLKNEFEQKQQTRLLKTFSAHDERSQPKTNNSPAPIQPVTKQRRKSSLKPTIETKQNYSCHIMGPMGNDNIWLMTGQFIKIGYKVIPKGYKAIDTKSSSNATTPCSECKENTNNVVQLCEESSLKRICENCGKGTVTDGSLRYYTEAEWLSVYSHLKSQFCEMDPCLRTGNNWILCPLPNGDILNVLDSDQETGPAGFPNLLASFVKINSAEQQVQRKDENSSEGSSSLPHSDIYITPAPTLDHEYAHCQTQLRTAKDQSIISKYNNRVKAYLDLVRSTLSTTPNALITPFEYFLADNSTAGKVSGEGSKTKRNQKLPTGQSETKAQLSSPATATGKKVLKRQRPQKPIDSIRRSSTRQIKAPRRPYDNMSDGDIYSSDFEIETNDSPCDSRSKRPPLVGNQRADYSDYEENSLDSFNETEFVDDSLSDEGRESLGHGKKVLNQVVDEEEEEDDDDDDANDSEAWVNDLEDQYTMYCDGKRRYLESKNSSAGLLSRFSDSDDPTDDDDDSGSEPSDFQRSIKRRKMNQGLFASATLLSYRKRTLDIQDLRNTFKSNPRASFLAGSTSKRTISTEVENSSENIRKN